MPLANVTSPSQALKRLVPQAETALPLSFTESIRLSPTQA
jgi:hypothetical protein